MKICFVLLTSLLFASNLFAHGEDVAGPHGGFIQMPGGFHTELVLKDKNLEVYLLDIEFKNPTTSNSSVKASWKANRKTVELACAADSDKFICEIPKSVNLKKGAFILEAKRNGVPAGLAEYKLPLHSVEKMPKAHP